MTLLLAGCLIMQWPPGPADEARAAVEDLTRHVAKADWPDTRYLSLYNLPRDDWADTAAVASLVLNSVSRAELIAVPRAAPGSQGRLLRLSLEAYQLPPAAWEQLASGDPYWHLQTEVLAGGKRLAVFTDGGWADLGAAARLRQLTGSAGAVLRADDFIARAATTLDGGLYYELAGVPERENDFFRQLGIDARRIGQLRADAGANLIRSQVTFKLRRVVRRPGPLGGAWHTYDVAQNTPERDPLRNPFGFEFDASEHIAARANGMLVYALYDRQGRRQATVPDAIAKDTSDPHGAGIIAPLVSCVRCHLEDGLRPVANDQRRLLESAGVELLVESPALGRRLAQFYGADLDKQLTRDREDYAAAVGRACGGRAPGAMARLLGQSIERYADQLVTPRRAADELGLPAAALAEALAESHDVALVSLCAGLALQRGQWTAAFGEAALRAEAWKLQQPEPREVKP